MVHPWGVNWAVIMVKTMPRTIICRSEQPLRRILVGTSDGFPPQLLPLPLLVNLRPARSVTRPNHSPPSRLKTPDKTPQKSSSKTIHRQRLVGNHHTAHGRTTGWTGASITPHSIGRLNTNIYGPETWKHFTYGPVYLPRSPTVVQVGVQTVSCDEKGTGSCRWSKLTIRVRCNAPLRKFRGRRGVVQ